MPRQLPGYILFVVVVVVIMCGMVLVGRSTPAQPGFESGFWEYTTNTIRPTHPASPFNTFIVTILAFLIPPLPLLHQHLLVRVYRYAFQPGEKQDWNNLSWMITGAISICAAVSIALWYNDQRVLFIRIVLVMTLICVVLGAGGAIWIGRKRAFSTRFIFLLALAAGLVSLVIPFGVLGIYTTWPFVLIGIVGYMYGRHENELLFEREFATFSNWQLDSITLGGMGVMAICLAVFVPPIISTSYVARDRGISGLFFLAAMLTLFVLLMNWITRIHLKNFSGKKKNNESAVSSNHYLFHWAKIAIGWGIISIFPVAGVFFGQYLAYFILNMLARY